MSDNIICDDLRSSPQTLGSASSGFAGAVVKVGAAVGVTVGAPTVGTNGSTHSGGTFFGSPDFVSFERYVMRCH